MLSFLLCTLFFTQIWLLVSSHHPNTHRNCIQIYLLPLRADPYNRQVERNGSLWNQNHHHSYQKTIKPTVSCPLWLQQKKKFVETSNMNNVSANNSHVIRVRKTFPRNSLSLRLCVWFSYTRLPKWNRWERRCRIYIYYIHWQRWFCSNDARQKVQVHTRIIHVFVVSQDTT